MKARQQTGASPACVPGTAKGKLPALRTPYRAFWNVWLRGKTAGRKCRARRSGDPVAGRPDQRCSADEPLKLVGFARASREMRAPTGGRDPGVPERRYRDSGRDRIGEIKQHGEQFHGRSSPTPTVRARRAFLPGCHAATLIPFAQFRKRKSKGVTVRGAIYIGTLTNSETGGANTVTSPGMAIDAAARHCRQECRAWLAAAGCGPRLRPRAPFAGSRRRNRARKGPFSQEPFECLVGGKRPRAPGDCSWRIVCKARSQSSPAPIPASARPPPRRSPQRARTWW